MQIGNHDPNDSDCGWLFGAVVGRAKRGYDKVQQVWIFDGRLITARGVSMKKDTPVQGAIHPDTLVLYGELTSNDRLRGESLRKQEMHADSPQMFLVAQLLKTE